MCVIFNQDAKIHQWLRHKMVFFCFLQLINKHMYHKYTYIQRNQTIITLQEPINLNHTYIFTFIFVFIVYS